MKFNNKLNLVEYLQVVNEIAQEFFDVNTYEYTPHIGEVYAVCAYYNHCVELEDTDEIKIHPIEDLGEMQQLYDNAEFMAHFWEEIDGIESVQTSFTFGHAYEQALDIVEYKKSDANSFAIAISSGMGAILNAFRESFSDDEIKKFTNIAQQVVEGKLSNQAIADAYENSDRFKENTEKLQRDDNVVIPFPQKK
jgi:hypothetical protein